MKNQLHMLSHNGFWQMMSFIVTTEDEKVIVIDGGYNDDAPKLLQKLKELTQSDVPHVDAWFLTHAHEDHIDAFCTLYETYADCFSCDAVYYCFPSVQYIEKYETGSAPTLQRFYSLLPAFASIAHTVSAGDCYFVGKTRFDILQTLDDTEVNDIVNNSSTIFRMTLNGKSVLFLGDAGREAGSRLLARYQDNLHADYCQMAHHGQDGARADVYAAIRPSACIWCAPEWLWNNDRGNGFDSDIFETVQTRAWMNALDVKEHYVMLNRDLSIDL